MHLEADRFFDFVRGGYVEPWKPESHEQNEVVMRAVAQAANTYAAAGYTTIVEGIVIPRWFLQPLVDALQGAGHEVAYAVLRAPLEQCRERVAARGPEALSSAGAVDGIWEQFEDLGPWERHVADATTADAQAVATEIEQRLERGELIL